MPADPFRGSGLHDLDAGVEERGHPADTPPTLRLSKKLAFSARM